MSFSYHIPHVNGLSLYTGGYVTHDIRDDARQQLAYGSQSVSRALSECAGTVCLLTLLVFVGTLHFCVVGWFVRGVVG